MRLIWDVPTRLFHWLLVLAIVGQWLTAEILEDAMQWHFYIGYFTLGLVAFRLCWGVIGTRYAKFSQFVTTPSTAISYARTMLDKNATPHAGHNPMGGWMVVIMLVILLAQAISGLFMTDDIFLDGPYYSAVSQELASLMSTIHHRGFTIIQGVVLLHILAVVFYVIYKRQPLISAMIHGKKTTEEPAIAHSKWLLALAVVVVVALIVYYLVAVAPPVQELDEYY